jgi:hypothetical protein
MGAAIRTVIMGGRASSIDFTDGIAYFGIRFGVIFLIIRKWRGYRMEIIYASDEIRLASA